MDSQIKSVNFLETQNRLLEKMNQLSQRVTGQEIDEKPETTFDVFFQAAMDNIDETNQLIRQAERLETDFALGKVDNLYEVMIAEEQSSTALQYTVQLRDRFLEAYNEIMRMQV